MTAIQRSKKAWICGGPKRSQISCSRSGSSQAANPLASSRNGTCCHFAWFFAHSWPLHHTLAG
jgi:hypothetical protein